MNGVRISLVLGLMFCAPIHAQEQGEGARECLISAATADDQSTLYLDRQLGGNVWCAGHDDGSQSGISRVGTTRRSANAMIKEMLDAINKKRTSPTR